MRNSPTNMYLDILRNDFNAFVHRSFQELNGQTPFLPNWHLEALAAKLEEVRLGRIKRLIINIPPRHLKSHVASIAFPAWLLGHDPSKRILTVCYAQDLSDKLARDSRALMTSPFYQAVFDTRLSPDRQAVGDFETTEGGYRYSSSVGGGVTGYGADIIIVDDPMKADDAMSDARRNSLNEWYDNTLRSRLNSQEKGAIVIVMQRLHANDLVAHVQEHEAWEVVSFPAIAELQTAYDVNTPYGQRTIDRYPGDVLQPALQSASTLERLRLSMTEYNFAAQYQQDPQPPAGLIVRREWLKFYTPIEKPEKFEKIIQSWDTANKATELSDYSACTTWGLKDKCLYLLDVFRRRMEFPELKRTVRELAEILESRCRPGRRQGVWHATHPGIAIGKVFEGLSSATNGRRQGYAPEVDTRQAIAAAKKALTSFSQTTKEVRRLQDGTSEKGGGRDSRKGWGVPPAVERSSLGLGPARWTIRSV